MNTGVPYFSIITIVFNGVGEIAKTIESVINQQGVDFEYIVIDGGSNDGTLDVINRYRDHITHVVSEKDHGISDAFNKGLKLCRGQWINFMNAGDFFVDHHTLQKVGQQIQQWHDYDVVYGKMNLVDNQHRFINQFGGEFNLARFRFEMNIPHQATFFRHSFFDAVGTFSHDYKLAMDYEILLRKRDLTAKFIPVEIVNMVAGGISQQNVKKVYAEFRKAKKLHLKKPGLLIDLEYYLVLGKVSFTRWLRKN